MDLLSNSDFRNWVKSGAFKNSGNYWSDWREDNPEHAELIKQAIHILLASHVHEDISENDINEITSGAWERIHSNETRVKPLYRWWWTTAAAVALIATGLWFTKDFADRGTPELSDNYTKIQKNGITERINSGNKSMLIILSDSSSVVLLPGSRLKYPSEFSKDSREVALVGEAFFEISKNPNKPFFVHTQAVTTRVLGTSFNIRAFDREPEINITVKTGKVSVYPKNTDKEVPQDAVVLLPYQRVSYNKEEHLMTQSSTTITSTPLSLKSASFEFVDAPVTTILDSIGNAYGLKMEYSEASLNKCILTTSLTDTPLQGKLKIICRALGQGASYRITDTGIEISGPGCE